MPPRVILRLIGIRTLCRPRLSPMFQAHNQCLRGSHSQPSCCSDRSKAHPRNMHARRTKGDPRRPLCRGHSNNAHDSRAGPPTALRPAPYGSTAIFRLARTSQRKTWPHTRKRRSQRQSSLHLASSWCSPQMNFSAITRPQPDSGMLALDQRSREKAAGAKTFSLSDGRRRLLPGPAPLVAGQPLDALRHEPGLPSPHHGLGFA